MYNPIIIHTDGACSNNQDREKSVGGWAYLLEYNGKTKSDSGKVILTTNNRMEMLAIIKALGALKRFDLPIEIHSDSNYVINTITNNWKRNKNQDLWEQLDHLLSNFDEIKFIKVKAHADNAKNNLVDQLAVKASLS